MSALESKAKLDDERASSTVTPAESANSADENHAKCKSRQKPGNRLEDKIWGVAAHHSTQANPSAALS